MATVKTSELAATLGVAKQTVINTANRLGISPNISKNSTFLFDEKQVRQIAESLGKQDELSQETETKEPEQEEPESEQNSSNEDAAKAEIDRLKAQIKAKEEQISGLNETISTLSKANAMLSEANKTLSETNRNLSESNKALAANANIHTLSDKKEVLLSDSQEQIEIMPKRSFKDRIKDFFK